jgi:hypothetical protein
MSFQVIFNVSPATWFFSAMRVWRATRMSASRSVSQPGMRMRPPKRCPVWWGDLGMTEKARTPVAGFRLSFMLGFQVLLLTYLW